jgi:hypothetical protein
VARLKIQGEIRRAIGEREADDRVSVDRRRTIRGDVERKFVAKIPDPR